MIGFLKNFLNGDKTADEQALHAANELQRKRDVMVIGRDQLQAAVDAYGVDGEEEEQGSCGTQKRGCGGCGCG